MLVRCSYLRRSWVALKRADSGGCWAAVLFLDLFSYWDKLGHCWGWVGGQCFGRGAAIRYMSDLVETESNEDAIKWNDDNKKYPADSVAGKGKPVVVHHETCKHLIANGVRRSMSSMLTSIGSTPVQRRDPPESVQDHMCRYLRLMEGTERPRGPQPSVK
jgi:hypothetical protein